MQRAQRRGERRPYPTRPAPPINRPTRRHVQTGCPRRGIALLYHATVPSVPVVGPETVEGLLTQIRGDVIACQQAQHVDRMLITHCTYYDANEFFKSFHFQVIT